MNEVISIIGAFIAGLDPQALWALGIASAVLGTLAFLPYIWDTLRSKTSPDRASWLIWSTMSSIALFSQVYEGASFSLYFSASQFGVTFLIFLLSIWFGRGAYFSDRNVIIFFLAFCGLITWYYTESAVYSLGISIGISILGSFNTIRKAYVDPSSETLATWVIVFVSAVCGVISVGSLDLVLMAYPLYLASLYGLIVIAIVLGYLAGNGLQPVDDFVSDGRLYPELESVRVFNPNQVDLAPLAQVLIDKPRIAQAASNPIFLLSAVISRIAICASAALTANFAWHLSDVEWLGLCLVFGLVSVNMMRPLLMANGVWWLSRSRYISGSMALTLAIVLSPIAILASTSAVAIAVDAYSVGLTEVGYSVVQAGSAADVSSNAYLKTVFELLNAAGITGAGNRFFLPLLVSLTLELAILMGTGLLARRSAVS